MELSICDECSLGATRDFGVRMAGNSPLQLGGDGISTEDIAGEIFYIEYRFG